MRRIFTALFSATALSIACAPAASAADMPVKAARTVPPPPVFSWTGFYVGINGGGAWGHETFGDNTTAPCPPCVIENHKPTGGVFGGQLGYRWQINQFVLGVEGTLDWARLTSDIAQGGGETETFKVKSLYTVTGQVGWAGFDRALLYVKGGWAGGTTNYFIQAPAFTADRNQTVSGWTVGGGVDYAVWRNLILGIEYDHFDLAYGGFTAPISTGGTPFIVANTSRLTIDQVVARLSYKFDWIH